MKLSEKEEFLKSEYSKDKEEYFVLEKAGDLSEERKQTLLTRLETLSEIINDYEFHFSGQSTD